MKEMAQLSFVPSKQWFSGLDFQYLMVSLIIPREAIELPLPCVQLITFIDLIGPPGHFSKTVIENAAWQASKSWADLSGQGGKQRRVTAYSSAIPAGYIECWSQGCWTRGHKTDAFSLLPTGLRERLRPKLLLAVNLISSKATMIQKP